MKKKENKFIDGIKLGLGFVFILSLLGLVYAVGFHIAEEILPGTFTGDFEFNGTVNFTNANVSGIDNGITLGNEQNISGLTSINFTAIPPGTKRIIIMFEDIGRTGTSNKIIRLGDSGGFETNDYKGTSIRAISSPQEQPTSGFIISSGAGSGDTYSGQAIISLKDPTDNTWTFSSSLGRVSPGAEFEIGAGSKSLSDELDSLSITTESGDTFSSGTINIQYE